jgi:CRP-like cAMP-binding protein
VIDWPLLRELSDGDKARLLAAGRRRRFSRREVVFHEGDPAESLHLVERGHVAVRTTTPLGDVATFSVVGPGGTFGELALLEDTSARSASVVALEPTETWSLRRPEFDALRAEHPSVDRFLVELLAGYVRQLSERLVDAHYVVAEKRVARRLAALHRSAGKAASIPLTQEDLASIAGTSRSTVNRVLGELERAGIVSVARGRISVADPEGLGRAAR